MFNVEPFKTSRPNFNRYLIKGGWHPLYMEPLEILDACVEWLDVQGGVDVPYIELVDAAEELLEFWGAALPD